jgi:starvation-inducible DNA-binding protein
MFTTPSRLTETSRTKITRALNQTLADGLDLQLQLKVAHWNVKGRNFAPLHALFEEIAGAVAGHNDDIAERAVTLGALALGTARHVAKASKLAEYPQETTRDLEHVRLIAERLEAYLDSVRAVRDLADGERDVETADLATGIAAELEKRGWMLRATLEG